MARTKKEIKDAMLEDTMRFCILFLIINGSPRDPYGDPNESMSLAAQFAERINTGLSWKDAANEIYGSSWTPAQMVMAEKLMGVPLPNHVVFNPDLYSIVWLEINAYLIIMQGFHVRHGGDKYDALKFITSVFVDDARDKLRLRRIIWDILDMAEIKYLENATHSHLFLGSVAFPPR